MTTSNHTRGPWVWGLYGPDDDWVRTTSGEAVVSVGYNQLERIENARLIAAAPDMRDALQMFAEKLTEWGGPHARTLLGEDMRKLLLHAQALLARIDSTESTT